MIEFWDKPIQRVKIEIDGTIVEQVYDFKYLRNLRWGKQNKISMKL